jgi:hypothetical protein
MSLAVAPSPTTTTVISHEIRVRRGPKPDPLYNMYTRATQLYKLALITSIVSEKQKLLADSTGRSMRLNKGGSKDKQHNLA